MVAPVSLISVSRRVAVNQLMTGKYAPPDGVLRGEGIELVLSANASAPRS
jgi:hypothetical protein